MGDPFIKDDPHRPAGGPVPAGTIRGAVLCRRRDEQGEIVVAQEGDERTLYFGGTVQSAIRTDRPELLLEDYHQAMMSALLFPDEIRSALVIGLGGCSLVHFLLNAAPGCSLDVVEIRRQVIDLAHEHFLLPPPGRTLRIIHGAAGDVVRSRPREGTYDLIIADAFDEAGPAACLLDRDFLSSCRALLNECGVLVMNAWNGPGQGFRAQFDAVQEAFGNNALKLLLSESYRNGVILGFRDAARCRDLMGRRIRAAELRDRLGIDLPRYLRYLYWQNFNAQDQ